MSDADPSQIAEDSPFDWPFFGLQDDVRPTLARARLEGKRAVLATLYAVEGGAPRGVGAQMAFVGETVAGYLSGGCIEADVALHARDVAADGAPRRLVYGEGGPMDIQLPCGSRIEVLLEVLEPDSRALDHLLSGAKARRPVVWISNGLEQICRADAEPVDTPPALTAAAALAHDRSSRCGRAEAPFALFRAYDPPFHIVAVGADPTALALVKIALEMGFQATLVRPFGPESPPIAGAGYLRSPVDKAMTTVTLDRWTAVAMLTHDLDQEHAALLAALRSEARYIGALGSRRRIPERNARLKAAGLNDAAIDRIHAPIGLPIGGQSPWEIAVSVIAEIVREIER